jgi:predicted GIY-YIG superfamily endonuclease
MLLFPDSRPLVERLGPDFFRTAPTCPGVYLMRDSNGTVLYVGKAKNLRKRLCSYRVANPDRLRKRHLKLLNSVARIQLDECANEQAALARESELLLSLKPPFNRAGTWLAPRRFVIWRVHEARLLIDLTEAVPMGWHFHGPIAAASSLRAALVRLCWCAIHQQESYTKLPEGWFHRMPGGRLAISPRSSGSNELELVAAQLDAACNGKVDEFIAWVCQRPCGPCHPFDVVARNKDLEELERLKLQSFE